MTPILYGGSVICGTITLCSEIFYVTEDLV